MDDTSKAGREPEKKMDLTAFQKELHAMSQKQAARNKTRGAFGGATKDNRMVNRLVRRFAK